MNAGGSRSFWDRISVLYDFTAKRNMKTYDILAGEISKDLGPNMDVLEIAAGTGILSERLSRFCGSYEVTDFSLNMVRIARRKKIAGNVSFSLQDAENLTYPDKSFDAVVVAHALHIVPRPEKVLNDIRRVLKDGGLLIAPTYVRSGDLLERFRERIMEITGFKAYHKWSRDGYLDFLASMGWQLVRASEINSSFPIVLAFAVKSRL